jgi:hypothetical protein
MPFAEHSRFVPGGLQHLSPRLIVLAGAKLLEGLVGILFNDMIHFESRQQGGARRRAYRRAAVHSSE